MKLPTVKSIKYDIFIKELNKKVKYRAFKKSEHRLLLQAIESGDADVLTNTVLELLDACTFKALEIDKLPMHIVDFLYLQIHLKSTGAIQEAHYKCGNVVEGVTCTGEYNLKLPLDRAEIFYPPDYEQKKIVMVDDDAKIGIKLQVPSLEKFKAMKPTNDVLDLTDQYVFACVECIFEKDSVQKAGVDFDEKTLLTWLDDQDGSVMEKITDFFKEVPYLHLLLPITCPICRRKEEMEIKGLNNFFA
jgi:hypothetical protein